MSPSALMQLGLCCSVSRLLGFQRPGVPRAEDNQITDECPQSLTRFLV